MEKNKKDLEHIIAKTHKDYPTSYPGNAYGDLFRFYDNYKNVKVGELSFEDKNQLWFNLQDLTNSITRYVIKTPIEPYQFKNIINRIKWLYSIFYEIDVIKIFQDYEILEIENNDAFDFELEPKIKLDERFLIGNPSDKISNAIEEVKNKSDLLLRQKEKLKPNFNEVKIIFKNAEIIEKVHSELKGIFKGKEIELEKVLKSEELDELLLFPHNQNKLVEFFKRLKYNGFLLSTPKEINDWICSNFMYQYQRGDTKEIRKFNTSTVHDILTKDKGEPTKKERICNEDWLPYKSRPTRQREAQKEKI